MFSTSAVSIQLVGLLEVLHFVCCKPAADSYLGYSREQMTKQSSKTASPGSLVEFLMSNQVSLLRERDAAGVVGGPQLTTVAWCLLMQQHMPQVTQRVASSTASQLV